MRHSRILCFPNPWPPLDKRMSPLNSKMSNGWELRILRGRWRRKPCCSAMDPDVVISTKDQLETAGFWQPWPTFPPRCDCSRRWYRPIKPWKWTTAPESSILGKTLFDNHPNVAFELSILEFSTNFCPIKIDLPGNTVSIARIDHFWHFL